MDRDNMAKSITTKRKTKIAPRVEYNSTLVLNVCEKLAQGNTLTNILSAKNMPSFPTFHRWINQGKMVEVKDDDGNVRCVSLAELYHSARVIRSHILADRLEDSSKVPLTGDKDIDYGVIQRARLKSDNIKWLLARINPKDYGNSLEPQSSVKLNINISLTPEPPVNRQIIDIPPKDTPLKGI